MLILILILILIINTSFQTVYLAIKLPSCKYAINSCLVLSCNWSHCFPPWVISSKAEHATGVAEDVAQVNIREEQQPADIDLNVSEQGYFHLTDQLDSSVETFLQAFVLKLIIR